MGTAVAAWPLKLSIRRPLSLAFSIPLHQKVEAADRSMPNSALEPTHPFSEKKGKQNAQM